MKKKIFGYTYEFNNSFNDVNESLIRFIDKSYKTKENECIAPLRQFSLKCRKEKLYFVSTKLSFIKTFFIILIFPQ